MRNEYIKRGEILPTIFPSGPKNPMGKYALYVGKNYAIHGTNSNFGIGLRITRGCVRLRSKDITSLYNLVPIGTRVQFINEPIKMTTETDGSQYIEVHNLSSFIFNKKKYNQETIITNIKNNKCHTITKSSSNVDILKINTALQEQNGIPTKITYCSKSP